MQTRLNDFFGFSIKNQSSTLDFNPFKECEQEPIKPTKLEKPVQKEIVNILDAPTAPTSAFTANTTTSTEPVAPLFPQRPSAPVPIPPSPEPVLMIQPRSKEGQRLLYKHPNLPCVGPAAAYWLLVGQSDRSSEAWLLQFDGAANPNPGPASSGAVLWSPRDLEGKRQPVFESGKFLGKATNNIAEVQGLLLGLQIAAVRGARELLIEGDSELIIFQQTGKYKVTHKNLKVWWANIQAAMMDETTFDWIAIRQVPREQNERADSITKEVLGRREGFQRGY